MQCSTQNAQHVSVHSLHCIDNDSDYILRTNHNVIFPFGTHFCRCSNNIHPLLLLLSLLLFHLHIYIDAPLNSVASKYGRSIQPTGLSVYTPCMRMCVFVKCMFVMVLVTQCVQCLLSIGMERRVFVHHRIHAQIFMWCVFAGNCLLTEEWNEKEWKKDIRTNDDKQIFLEHTHAHSLARTHLSFSVLSMHLIFFYVYVHVALQFHVYTVRMTNLFIFCILLVPFYFGRFFSRSLVFYPLRYVFVFGLTPIA